MAKTLPRDLVWSRESYSFGGGKNEKVELFHLTDRLDFSDSIVMYSE
jgi:hypothetical protein